MSDYVIISRNPLIVEWFQDLLQKEGKTGTVLEGNCKPEDLAHKHVLGLIPLFLAHFAASVTELSVIRISPADRERFNRGDMTLQELNHYRPTAVTYQIRKVPPVVGEE